jgi:hypothetical protein
MMCNSIWFYDLHERTINENKFLGANRSHEIKVCGNVCVQFPSGCVNKIENAMYVPRIKKNLIFVSTIVD